MSNISKYFVTKKRNRRRKGLELTNFLSFMFVTVLAISTIALLGQLRTYAQEIPTEDKVRANLENKGENSRIYDRNGVLLYTFKDPDRDRVYAEFEEIPRSVIAAAMAAEDKDFYMHEGVNYVATFRSLLNNVTTDTTQGGSTITQQLVKQTLLTSDQSLDRKVKEALIAMLVERDYEKEQILEYYLNVSNFGGRVIGIKTAASTYFNKDLKDLSLTESAFLIALLQSPGEYSPLFASDTARAESQLLSRRNYVLDKIAENDRIMNYLNTGEKQFLYEPLPEGLVSTTQVGFTREQILALKQSGLVYVPKAKEFLRAPHWVFYVRDLLGKAPYNLSIKDLYSGGYDIYTSIDIRVQEMAEQKVLEGVQRLGPRYRFENSALVSIDPASGEVLAMVGSKGYDLPNDPANRRFDPQVNVTLSLRNLGSTLKPWVSYLGFSEGKYNPNSSIEDTAQTFYGYYRPKNVDGRFYGNMTVKMALLESRNLPFLKILYKIGDWKLGDLMKKIGYRSNSEYGLAAAIGGVSETLLGHTQAYSGLANGGTVHELKPVLKILAPGGKQAYISSTQTKFELDRKAVSQVNSILGFKGYTVGNSVNKFIGNQKLAGKTGTSDGNKDTFYMGYGPKIMTGIWCGNNDNTRMRSDALGSSTALLIWNSYTRELFKQFPQYSQSGSY